MIDVVQLELVVSRPQGQPELDVLHPRDEHPLDGLLARPRLAHGFAVHEILAEEAYEADGEAYEADRIADSAGVEGLVMRAAQLPRYRDSAEGLLYQAIYT